MRVKRLLVVPLLAAAACKPPTPTEQMDSVISWLATGGTAGKASASIERLSAWTLVSPIGKFLEGRKLYSLYRVPWQDMDLSDPHHPKLRAAK